MRKIGIGKWGIAVRLVSTGLGNVALFLVAGVSLSKPIGRRTQSEDCPHAHSALSVLVSCTFVNEDDKISAKESRHDRLHRGMGAYAVRPARYRDGRKPDRAGRDRCARRCRHRALRRGRDRARPFQCGVLGAGFYRLAGAAGLARPALQARDAGRERLRDRLGGGASGPARARGQGRAHRARGRRRADDHDARAGDRPQPAEGLLREGRGQYRGRLRGHLRQDRRAPISRNTATSPMRSR